MKLSGRLTHLLTALTMLLVPALAFSRGAVEPAPEPAVEANISEVTMFTNGTSLVRYRIPVSGSGELTLSIPAEDMEDILKTLVVRDMDGGVITSAGYTASDPVARSLSRLHLDLSGSRSMENILAAGTGYEVRLTTTGGIFTGTILGINGNSLSLLQLQRVRNIETDSISSVQFTDAAVQQDFLQAAELLSQSTGNQRKEIQINFEGDGDRTLQVVYLRPSPIWKSSYRLVAGEDGALLQGWSIVENTSAANWEHIDLTLSTARPISFLMDLYTPKYTTRPRLDVPDSTPVAIPRSANEPEYARASLYMAPAAEAAYAAAYEDEWDGMSSSLDNSAEVSLSGSLNQTIEYRMRDVSISARNSAMVPFIESSVDADSISLYASGDNRVFRSIIITNTSEATLTPGPLAIYDGGSYAGEGIIPRLQPGESTRIDYALNGDLEITHSDTTSAETLVRLQAANGILTTSAIQQKTREYKLDNHGSSADALVLIHQISSGWTITSVDVQGPAHLSPESEDFETGDGSYRFEISGDSQAVITFTEERVLSRQYQLSGLQDDFILTILGNSALSDSQKAVLERLAELRTASAEAQRAVRTEESRRDQLYRDQQRIVANMANLSQDSSLYQRYVTMLDEQETTVQALLQNLDALKIEADTRRQELSDFINTIEF